MLQYAIQGAAATGHNPAAEFTRQFWVMDWILWALRALVEAWVVVYVFMTTPQSTMQRIALTAFELILIAIITLTLGPALHALGAGKTVYEVLGRGHLAWEYAIAAYTSIMMGAAAFAYQFQPFDIKEEVVIEGPGKKRKMEPEKENVTREEALPVVLETIRAAEGGKINQAELAGRFDVSRQTMGNWLKFWQREMVIAPLDGRGRFRVIEEEVEMPEFG